jgi:arylsulfatase A-like enzyme/enterochelin esterase-like enzyme
MYRLLIIAAFWLVLYCDDATSVLVQASTPNVIVVISDDQGWGELSSHGNPIVRTPHLDRIRDQSIRFTNFHVAPMCTPTRAQLMTGCDAVRTKAVNVSSGRTLLRRDFATMPELLQSQGHATGLFGKWHLGDNFPYRPQDRGFQEVVTFPSSHIGSVPDMWLNDYFDDTYLHNGNRKAFEGYTTDCLFSESMRWMKEQQSQQKPFFTYLATAAPHSPHYVPERYRLALEERYRDVEHLIPKLESEVKAQLIRYLAMVENLDDNMGRLEHFLQAENLRENTLLVFLSDNGTTFGDQYYPAGMRGKKVTLWEGGHRVPLFVRWPGGAFTAPRDLSDLTHVQDLLPTILDLVGCPTPKGKAMDGMSLVPLLRGTAEAIADRVLFVNYSRMPFRSPNSDPSFDPASLCELKKEGAAVLWRDWRWIEDRELYNLSSDPLQKHDVAAEFPEIAATMRGELDRWWQRVSPGCNTPERVVIGHASENPTMLTACEWWNVFVDQQGQVRRGERKNGVWHLEIASSGDYEIELRRWPRESNLALTAAAPQSQLSDGSLGAGTAIPIAQARLKIGDQITTLPANGKSVSFRYRLEKGETEMQSEFLDSEGRSLLGAYYAYVSRVTSPDPPQGNPNFAMSDAMWLVEPKTPLPEYVTHHRFHSDSMNKQVGFCLYLPPSYRTHVDRRYPVIYHLHGAGGNETRSIRSADVLDEGILQGRWPEMIMVFPNGGRHTMYLDSADGRFLAETMMIRELIPWVDKNYRTIADRKARCIEGFSMGGRGSTNLAMKHPDMFGSLFNQSGNVFPISHASQLPNAYHGSDPKKLKEDDPYENVTKNLAYIQENLRIRMGCGTDDPEHLTSIRQFHRVLQELKVEHEYFEVEGLKHNQADMIERARDTWFQFHVESLKRFGVPLHFGSKH